MGKRGSYNTWQLAGGSPWLQCEFLGWVEDWAQKMPGLLVASSSPAMNGI
jgi:hypothetical protein